MAFSSFSDFSAYLISFAVCLVFLAVRSPAQKVTSIFCSEDFNVFPYDLHTITTVENPEQTHAFQESIGLEVA